MSTCNKALQAEGKTYPRTCQKCGPLGPCKEEQRHENAALKAIAGHIQKLSYRDMRKLSELVAAQIGKKIETAPTAEVLNDLTDALLNAADTILSADNTPSVVSAGPFRR